MKRRAPVIVLMTITLASAPALAQLEEYVPDASRNPSVVPAKPSKAPPPSASGGAGSKATPKGGGTPPSLLISPITPLTPTPPPTVPGSEDATARMKRDLLAPGVEALERDKAKGGMGIDQKRELLMRKQELHRLEVDPLKR